MAYVYPEDRIVSGEVIDPRPINRLLGRYYAEFNGMLDRDNFYQEAFTAGKIKPFTNSAGVAPTCTATEHDYLGPFNTMKAKRSTLNMTVQSIERSVGFEDIDDMRITMNTLDSALCIDFSVSFEWEDLISNPAMTTEARGCLDFCIVVDGITIDSTGDLGSPINTRGCAYLCSYTTVGAGQHTIVAKYSRRFFGGGTAYLIIKNRELIVREVRR